MAVSEIHLKAGQSLGKMTSATVILPEGHPGPFPVLYLLHGMTDDHTTWVRRTSLERYVDGLPLIVVMPNGERGFYIDAKSRPKSAYDTYITRELIGFVEVQHRADGGGPEREVAPGRSVVDRLPRDPLVDQGTGSEETEIVEERHPLALIHVRTDRLGHRP